MALSRSARPVRAGGSALVSAFGLPDGTLGTIAAEVTGVFGATFVVEAGSSVLSVERIRRLRLLEAPTSAHEDGVKLQPPITSGHREDPSVHPLSVQAARRGHTVAFAPAWQLADRDQPPRQARQLASASDRFAPTWRPSPASESGNAYRPSPHC